MSKLLSGITAERDEYVIAGITAERDEYVIVGHHGGA